MKLSETEIDLMRSILSRNRMGKPVITVCRTVLDLEFRGYVENFMQSNCECYRLTEAAETVLELLDRIESDGSSQVPDIGG